MKLININKIETKYTILKDGRVFNKAKDIELKGSISSNGYNRVQLFGERILRHRLIATKFLPLIDGKDYVNHKDGNKLNNNASNLEWCTMSENIKHAFVEGLKHSTIKPMFGQNNANATLTDKQVISIRNEVGLSAQELADKYNTSKSTIKHILKGRTWKHLLKDRDKPIILKNKRIKMNFELAREIRKKFFNGEKGVDLALHYNVKPDVISKIVRSVTWKEE